LGGNTQYISGSNGFIEVSSSNIHIERDGNLTVRRVTANDGFIGGSGGFGIKDSLLQVINKRIVEANSYPESLGRQIENAIPIN